MQIQKSNPKLNKEKGSSLPADGKYRFQNDWFLGKTSLRSLFWPKQSVEFGCRDVNATIGTPIL